jgi:hypothetical protein
MLTPLPKVRVFYSRIVNGEECFIGILESSVGTNKKGEMAFIDTSSGSEVNKTDRGAQSV